MHFLEFDWQSHEQNWTAWWAGDLDRPLVVIENPVRSRRPEELSQEFLLEKPVEQVVAYFQNRLENTRYHGDAWPKWFPFFGAGIVAGFVGAKVNCAPEMEIFLFRLITN